VPPDDVAETVEHVGARALAVSVSAVAGDRAVPRELRRLRTLLPARVDLLIVRPDAGVDRAEQGEIDKTPFIGLAMLRSRLRALRAVTRPRMAGRKSRARAAP